MVSILFLCIGYILHGIYVYISIKPLNEVIEAVKKMQYGNENTNDKKPKNEIRFLLDGMSNVSRHVGEYTTNINNVLIEVEGIVERLKGNIEKNTRSVEGVANAIDEIAKGAVEQTQETENCVKMVNSFAERLAKLQQSSIEMRKLFTYAMQENEKGNEAVGQMEEKNHISGQAVQDIEKSILYLNEQVQAISHMLSGITQISDQTNLLALNAAIEAARVGEKGRGFAVVADEIRKLAESAGILAKKIEENIANISNQSEYTVMAMNHVKSANESQNIAFTQVKEVFAEIFNSFATIDKKTSDISNYIEDMKQYGDRMVMAIENIAAVSEETAASSQQVSAAVQETVENSQQVEEETEFLNMLAQALKEEAHKFKAN